MSGHPSGVTVGPISADATRPLRKRVLRPHQAIETLVYPGDTAPGALHMAAFQDGRIVGIASLAPEAFALMPGETGAFRLRGMATEPGLRSHGIGGAVLEGAIAQVARHGARLIWCNARVPARSFYLRHGFQSEGDVFELPEIGPHVVMWRRLTP